MISYLMSQSRYIVCRALYGDLQALNGLNELSLRDRTMARLKLSQFRNSLGQVRDGILFNMLHGCDKSRLRVRSLRCVEESRMRRPRFFIVISPEVFHYRQGPRRPVGESFRSWPSTTCLVKSETLHNQSNPS